MGKSSLNGGKIYKTMDVLMEPYGKKTSDNGGFSIAIFDYWPEGNPQHMVFHMVQIHVLVGDLEHESYDFPYVGNNIPNGLIFSRRVETTNQYSY